MATRKKAEVIVYIATSIDGYIAAPNDDLSFLASVEQAGEDYGYQNFMSKVGSVIMGRRTYDWVMNQVPEFPHAHIPSYIVTRTAKPSQGQTHFYTGNVRELVENLKNTGTKHIFVDGGAQIVNLLLAEKLIDQLIISVVPTLLGNGIRLFSEGFPAQNFKLLSAKPYASGLVQMHYQKTEKV